MSKILLHTFNGRKKFEVTNSDNMKKIKIKTNKKKTKKKPCKTY